MKALFAALILALTTFTHAKPYRLSYRSIIMDPKNSMAQGLGQECLRVLRESDKRGEKLSSEKMRTMLVAIGTRFPNVTGPTMTFYHYTTSKEVQKIGHSNRFTRLFDFLRASGSHGTFDSSVLFVADDSESSKSYGNIQLRLQLRTDTIILDEEPAVGAVSPWPKVAAEIKHAYPELAACQDGPLYYLTAEDMGVGLIRYAWGSGGKGHWYQLISPDVIDHVEAD